MKAKPSLTVITNSEIKTFRRCAREHFYAYILGYRAIDAADELRFGTIFHAGLEEWWLGHGVDAAIDRAVTSDLDPYEAVKVRILLLAYDALWNEEIHEVVGVEREFCAPLVNPLTGAKSRTFLLGGKMDVLLRRRFVEHKTTSEDIGIGSVYWRKLAMDTQISTYYAGAKSLGHEVDGCIYDVIKKPTIRPSNVTLTDEQGLKIVLNRAGERVRNKPSIKQRKNETDEEFSARLRVASSEAPWRQSGDAELGYVLQTRPETPEEYGDRLVEDVAANPDKYFQRGEIVRLERDELEAAQDTWQTASAMRDARANGIHPRNPDACPRYGRLCDYFDVCSGVASIDDPARFQRLENVHAELSAALNKGDSVK